MIKIISITPSFHLHLRSTHVVSQYRASQNVLFTKPYYFLFASDVQISLIFVVSSVTGFILFASIN